MMKTAIFYGNMRKGSTHKAVQFFKDELARCGDVVFKEFFMPRDLPQTCTGCQACLSSPCDTCPHAASVQPILDAILQSDALVFATPHAGASAMPASMKNLLDHLDFLVLPVAPREAVFTKKAFVLSTGSGSAKASKEIAHGVRHWGVNRVSSMGLRMFTNKWDSMPQAKQRRFEMKIRRTARRFHKQKTGRPTLSALVFWQLSKFVLKRYVGKDAYPYRYWEARGWFAKNPLFHRPAHQA